MTQEEKELLLKDLCARLPYGVKVGTLDNDGSLGNIWDVLRYNTFTEDIKLINSIEDADKIIDVSEIKPYLFPLSSMTKEQKEELFIVVLDEQVSISDCSFNDMTGYSEILTNYIIDAIDWFNKHHLDYRGLIQKGLAIDATNLNIY